MKVFCQLLLNKMPEAVYFIERRGVFLGHGFVGRGFKQDALGSGASSSGLHYIMSGAL